MKTRLLFATMVLPTLFAACTNDEIMENQSPSLDGRALLNPNFSISVVDGADTRFSWNEKEFGWNAFTAEDKFSAGLVDNDGTVQDKVLTNYIFSTADGNNYTTTSQMVEGVYMFYSYPGFESNAKREPLAFDLTKQVSTDLKNPTKVIDDNQLFIAPLYNLEAETANEQLGLTFYSYWSAAAIAIKNASKQSFKIVRILLTDKTTEFAVKGKVSPEAMKNKNMVYSYDETSKKYVLHKDAKDILTENIADGKETKNPSLVLECNSYELAAGASTVAYMQVPAGFYNKGDMKVEVVVEVAEGKETSLKSLTKDVVTNFKDDEGNDIIRFRRGKTTSAFGITNGTPVAYEVDEVDLLSADAANGLYASSYEDMYNYLTDAEIKEDPLEIYNVGSLSVDDKLMSLVSRLNRKNVSFINAIEITSESRTEAKLMKMKFEEGATITKGNIVFGENVEVPANKALTINEGATATLGSAANATTFVGVVKNNGTLKLNGSTVTEVENGEKAVVEVVGTQIWGTDGIETINMPAVLKVAKDKTLNIKSALTIGYGQKLENNGTITATATLTNNGEIENRGTISAVTNTNLDKAGNGAKKIAVINNYGKLTTVTGNTNVDNGNSKVIMKSEDASIETVTNGEVDNTIGGYITTNNNAVVFAEYEGDQTGKLGNVMACTKVILKNGTWKDAETEIATIDLSGVTLTEDVAFEKATEINMTNCTVEKNMTLKEATTLNLRGVTFKNNVTATKATAVAIQNTPNVENTTTTFKGETDFGTGSAVTVNAGATLAVEVGAKVTAESLTNEGTVSNRGELAITEPITNNGEWKGDQKP